MRRSINNNCYFYKKIAGCLKALPLQSRDERLSRADLSAYRLSNNDITLFVGEASAGRENPLIYS
jgi:hypothetical protein